MQIKSILGISLPFTRAETVLIGLVAVYALAEWGVAHLAGVPGKFNAFLYVDTAALCSGAFALGYILYRIARLYWVFIVVRPPRLAAYLKQDFEVAAYLDVTTVNISTAIATCDFIEEITDFGKNVLAYTVNDPLLARRLQSWGVDAMFTDVPDVLMETLLTSVH